MKETQESVFQRNVFPPSCNWIQGFGGDLFPQNTVAVRSTAGVVSIYGCRNRAKSSTGQWVAEFFRTPAQAPVMLVLLPSCCACLWTLRDLCLHSCSASFLSVAPLSHCSQRLSFHCCRGSNVLDYPALHSDRFVLKLKVPGRGRHLPPGCLSDFVSPQSSQNIMDIMYNLEHSVWTGSYSAPVNV